MKFFLSTLTLLIVIPLTPAATDPAANLATSANQDPSNAAGWLERVWQKYRANDYEGANADATRAIELAPTATAHLARALIRSEKRDYEGAIEDYTAAIARYNWSEITEQDFFTFWAERGFDERHQGEQKSYLYALRGDAKHMKNDIDGALIDLNQAVELDANNFQAYLYRAFARIAKNELTAAISDADKVIHLHPKLPDGHGVRGSAKAKAGDLEGAIKDYNRAIELDPKYTWALEKRAETKINKGDFNGAMIDYDRLVELEPTAARNFYNRCNARHNRSDYDLAIADCTKAIELSPKYAAAYAVRGSARAYKYELAAAIKDYDQALTLSPKYTWALKRRASAKSEQKDHAGALADYDRLLEINPGDADAFSGRGDVKRKKKDYEGAAADYTKAMEVKPKDIGLLMKRASTRRQAGDEASATSDYAKAAAIDAAKASNWFEIAFYKAFRDGCFEESLADFTRAIELNPKLVGAYWERGLAYMGLGRLIEAEADLRKAVELTKAGEQYADVARLSLWMVRARSGEKSAANADLTDYLKTRPLTKSSDAWAILSFRYFASELSEAEFLRQTELAKPGSAEKDRLNSFFMAAMGRLAAGNRAGAALMFEKCVSLSEEPFGWFYWNSVYELKKLPAPPTIRNPGTQPRPRRGRP